VGNIWVFDATIAAARRWEEGSRRREWGRGGGGGMGSIPRLALSKTVVKGIDWGSTRNTRFQKKRKKKTPLRHLSHDLIPFFSFGFIKVMEKKDFGHTLSG